MSDAHCAGNALCMPMTFGDSEELGTFCLEPESEHGNDCSTSSVFIATEEDWTSLDGTSARVCKPRLTTCQGYNDFIKRTDCMGTDEEGDAECGVEGLDDGVCRPFGAVFRCSYPCESLEECPGRCEPLQSGGPKSCAFP